MRHSRMAICREQCAFMGEPPRFEIAPEIGQTWPPASCDDPGCMVLAIVALTMYLNPRAKP